MHEKYVVKGTSKKLQNEGFVGYDWVNGDMNGYTYYRFYDAGNNQYWIYTLNNGGGNGNFTDIYLVTRKDSDSIYVQGGISGNDCWAGIDNVSEKNHVLTYSTNLTTSGLIELVNDKLSNDLTNDLASCPHACCVAEAYYTLKAESKPPQLNFVRINKEPVVGKYQDCFHKIYSSFTKKNGAELSASKLNDLVVQFEKSCVSPKA